MSVPIAVAIVWMAAVALALLLGAVAGRSDDRDEALEAAAIAQARSDRLRRAPAYADRRPLHRWPAPQPARTGTASSRDPLPVA